MKIGQRQWTKEKGWIDVLPQKFPAAPQLVLVFGGRSLMEDKKYFEEIHSFYPDSHIIECSTAGEILGSGVRDDSIALTAVLFERTVLHFVEADIVSAEQSAVVGKELADALPKENLEHAMVFSDGLRVNGTALVKGLNGNLPSQVSVTGGLVGDGAAFKKTVVGLDHVAQAGKIVLVGFSGTALKVGYGSLGGWDAFGIERRITKSNGNILLELDGKPALELYKTYLGKRAEELPSAGLLFPLRLHTNHGNQTEVVRTVLGVSESDQSMTFAGDMPEGATAMLMKANFERLIDGASGAGSMSIKPLGAKKADLAILVSCVGRKLVLKERTEEEVEAVRMAIGKQAVVTGFYSYGELCPTASTNKQCRLHNQTMTITTFREDVT
jgi:hypothetical protein